MFNTLLRNDLPALTSYSRGGARTPDLTIMSQEYRSRSPRSMRVALIDAITVNVGGGARVLSQLADLKRRKSSHRAPKRRRLRSQGVGRPI